MKVIDLGVERYPGSPQVIKTRCFTNESDPRVVEYDLYADIVDISRMELLRDRLINGVVRASAHTAVRASIHTVLYNGDVAQVYLEPRNDKEVVLFACVVVSTSEVERMLEKEKSVVETCSFQVAIGRQLTESGLVSALEAWTERNFPDLPLPKFDLHYAP
jgi:hypothetical protein